MADPRTDHLALTRLINDYSHGFDKRHWARFAAVWHPDTVWEVEPDSYHHNANQVFNGNDDTATGMIDVLAGWRTTEGLRFTGTGTYYDTYTRAGEGWLITHRRAPELEITAITNPDGTPAPLD